MSSYASVCRVVEELLPIWREGLVQPATARFVEDHLRHCEACRALDSAARDVERAQLPSPSSQDSQGEPGGEGTPLRFSRRQARALWAALAAVAIVVAGGGAASAWYRQAQVQARYEKFLRTVPGYAAAAADGAVIPLHQTARVGGETVTLRAFYATYLGSYIVYTVKGSGSARPMAPSLGLVQGSPPNPDAPSGGRAATTTTYVDMTPAVLPRTSYLSSDEIADVWAISWLPSPRPSQGAGHPATTLRFALNYLGAGTHIKVVLPKGAFRPKAIRTLRRTMTLTAGGAVLRLQSLTISSAGTIVRGEVRGATPGFTLVAPCPAFLGKSACAAQGQRQLLLGDGQAKDTFIWIMPSPERPTSEVTDVAVPLTGVRTETYVRFTAKVAWPLPSTASGAVPLGTVDGYRLGALGLTAQGFTVQGSVPENAAPNALTVTGASVTLPGGGRLSAYAESSSTSASEIATRLKWGGATTAEELMRPGQAQISLDLVTRPVAGFGVGTVWRP